MFLESNPFPFKNIYPFFPCHSSLAFSFVTFLDLSNQIVFRIVSAPAKRPLFGCVYLWSSFLNPASVTDQILNSLTNNFRDRKYYLFGGGCKLFLNFNFVNR